MKKKMNHISRKIRILGIFAILLATIMPTMAFVVKPLTLVSGPSPFLPGCNGVPQSGINYFNAEVEPWVATNPMHPANIIGVWQQDRWSNGGSNGLIAGISQDGGKNWIKSMAHFSRCSGGNAANGGDYERASDPWVTFSPNGKAYQISISFNDSNVINGVLVSKSSDGGTTWTEPTTLIRDTSPTIFNDKESITADPTNANNVYAVWDRLVFPSPMASASAAEHALAFRGPVMFSRTTDENNWEPAKVIFDPGENAQTIGNQIVVLPNGNLVDVFDLYYVFKNSKNIRGASIAVIRSQDKGLTWSKPTIISKPIIVGVFDPETGTSIRTSDILPEIAVDSTNGNLYVVWQDGRFDTGRSHIAFSMSTDGGLTFTDPVRIDKTPNGVFAFTPSINVASDGTIGATYYDFRNNDASPDSLPTDYWIVHCQNDCTNPSNWEENHVAGPFDMQTAPLSRGYFVGDYEGLSNIGNKFVPLFVQTNNDKVDQTTDVFATTAGP